MLDSSYGYQKRNWQQVRKHTDRGSKHTITAQIKTWCAFLAMESYLGSRDTHLTPVHLGGGTAVLECLYRVCAAFDIQILSA